MRFKKIRIKNIRSYKDQEIEFPEGSLLLSGDAGAGKSSILLAIEYALFGLQPGQKGTSLLRNNYSSGEVFLEVEIDGKTILIERKLKRSAKGVSNEYAAITIEGEKIESSLTEIKSKIVSLLGYPIEFVKKNNVLYRYTVYTPQEQMKQIILEDPESRLNVLRHIFGIDKYKKIKDNLLILSQSLKIDSKFIQGEISTLNQDKENLEIQKSNFVALQEKVKLEELELNNKTSIREKIEKELNELKEKIEERKSFLSEIEKTKIMIVTKKEILFSINKEVEELTKTLSEEEKPFDEKEYFSLLSSVCEKKLELDKKIAKNFEIAGKINSLEQERDDFLAKKERIYKIDICPTCLQNVPENHKHNILNEAESRISKIKKIFEELKKEQEETKVGVENEKLLLKELEEKKLSLEILKSKLEYLKKSRDKLADLEKQKGPFEKDIHLLTSHIESLKGSLLEYATFENYHKIKENEVKRAAAEEKNTEILLAELNKELELANKNISLLQETILKKEELKKKLQELSELSDWLSSQFFKLIELTERNVLFRLRAEFSSVFRKWFLMLAPDSSLDSQIDENFTPIIMQDKIEMDYSFLSGGERTAVALAYRLALNQTINSLLSKIKTRGIIMLDEPTDGFSEAQVNKIRDILEELNAEQLIIVSHEQKVEGFVNNVLRVVKEGDSSTIEGAFLPQEFNDKFEERFRSAKSLNT